MAVTPSRPGSPTCSDVAVPGARLHTERTGEGPPVLLIPGGGGDAGVYEALVPLLARRHTVISYDRRGNSRSPFTDPGAAIDVATQAADAVAVLDQHGVDRAFVFASSGSAIMALGLVADHPDRLLGLVAHEPPLMSVLPEGSPERQVIADLARLARERGPLRAYAALGAMTVDDPPWIFRSGPGQALVAAASRVALPLGAALRRVTGREADPMTRQLGNADLLFLRELPLIGLQYRPDLEALRASPAAWCLATGQGSVGRPYHRPAHVLAELAGVPCEEFPGGHVGYLTRPQEFAAKLEDVLGGLLGGLLG